MIPIQRRLSSAQWVVLSAWGSRILTAFVTIFSLRVLSGGLTASDYATYVVVLSLAGWYALAGDMGIGYAAQNSVTRKRALEQDTSIDIIAAYILLAVAGTAVIFLTYIFSNQLSGRLFSKISNDSSNSRVSILLWSGLLFTITATAGASSKILYAMHKGYIANLLNAASAVIGLVVLTTFLSRAENKVLFAVAALYVPAALFALLLAIRQIKSAWNIRKNLRISDFRPILRGARGFIVFNIIAAAVLQVDYIIMSQRVSELEIVQYYNIAKLFAFSSFFNQAIMMALWPKLTEMHSRSQIAQIEETIQKLIAFGVTIAVLTAGAIIVGSKFLVNILAPGSGIEFRYPVIVAFGAIALCRCITDPYAIYLQSVGEMRPLIVFAACQALIGGLLQWLLSGWIGIEGILIALALSFLLTVTWGLPRAAKISMSRVRFG